MCCSVILCFLIVNCMNVSHVGCFFFFFFCLGCGVCTYKCRGPNLDLVVVVVVCFWMIYGVLFWTRVVQVAEGSFGTMGVCIEVWVFFVCRVVSWLELVVVSRVC